MDAHDLGEDGLAAAEQTAEEAAQMFDEAAQMGAAELPPEAAPVAGVTPRPRDPDWANVGAAAAQAQDPVDDGPQNPSDPANLVQNLLAQLQRDPAAMQMLRDALGSTEYDPRDLQGRPMRFFRCTRTHYGPVLLPDGQRQLNYQNRPNSPITEIARVWVTGRIYPFRSLAQLPKHVEKEWERDEEGNIVYMDDPQAPDPKLADRIPKPLMDYDPRTGKRTQRVTVTDQVINFEEVHVPVNQVMAFLNGAGFRATRIENPLNGAKVEGNYVNGSQVAEARRLTTAEKARMAEREAELATAVA